MKKSKNHELEVLDIIKTKNWDRANMCNDKYLHRYIYRHKDTDENCKIIWEHINRQRDHKSEVSKIIETKDWGRAYNSNDKKLYKYVCFHKEEDKNCKIIWNHIKSRDYESEISEIIETKDWDKAKKSNDISLYQYVRGHRNTDEGCRTIWEYIRFRVHESKILDIVKTKDWDRARQCNDKNLYSYIKRHKDTDENCKIIWEHISIRNRDHKSEISKIIETEDWNKARQYNDNNLYFYIKRHKDTDENCKIIWEHISANLNHYTIKDYLQYYFKHGRPTKTSNIRLSDWFQIRVRKGNQCCIDVKNLIIATETYKDPVATETLDLIKNHLEKEDT